MNNYFKIFIYLFCLVEFSAIGQVFQNNGGRINARPGCFIRVNGSLLNEYSGFIDVSGNASSQAELFVSEDITNNAFFVLNGHARLLGNWVNNFAFDSDRKSVV